MPPSPTTVRLATAAATPLAVLLAGGLIYQSSQAAFSGQTRNSGNSWNSATVALSDDDAGAARFQAANLTPGQTETKCIRVTATTTVGGTVKAYMVNPVRSPQGVENYVKIGIRAGDGGAFGSCSGFTATSTVLPATALKPLMDYDTYEEGMDTWTVPAGTSTRTYELTWRFDTTGLTQSQIDALQGGRTGIDFQMELRSS